MYHNRYIWYYSRQIDKQKRLILFLDEELRNREEKDYLNRIESKVQDYTINKFYAKDKNFVARTRCIVQKLQRRLCKTLYAEESEDG
jgi:hypothetical protein